MPLTDDEVIAIRNLLGPNRRRHIVHSQSETMPLTQALQAQRDSSCESWAVRAMQVGPNIVDPPTVFTNIARRRAAIANGHAEGFRLVAEDCTRRIHQVFGDLDHESVGTNAPLDTWNARKEDLHTTTARIFDLCLEINGFTLSTPATDYMVCMEYECASGLPMYPNFTHAWLMLRQEFVIQTVPGANISISCHHAGHQPHVGYIRRYVRDFHAGQLAIIRSIIGSPMQAHGFVTNCTDDFVADGAPWPTDVRSPPGKIASLV